MTLRLTLSRFAILTLVSSSPVYADIDIRCNFPSAPTLELHMESPAHIRVNGQWRDGSFKFREDIGQASFIIFGRQSIDRMIRWDVQSKRAMSKWQDVNGELRSESGTCQ